MIVDLSSGNGEARAGDPRVLSLEALLRGVSQTTDGDIADGKA